MQRDLTQYDMYTVFTDLLNKYEFTGELNEINLTIWFDDLPDKIRYITTDLLNNIDYVEYIIALLRLKNPYFSKKESKPLKTLANILNFYHYEGEWTDNAIIFWTHRIKKADQKTLISDNICYRDSFHLL